MKLSVCIPVYNFDVRELVRHLQKEITEHQISAEILLIDDASDQNFIHINKELENEVGNFVFLEKNVGRSQIRNLFLYYASADYLLFLDCDGKITNPHFLKNYLSYIEKNDVKAVYGGRKVSEIQPDSNHLLRWRYANERENLPLIKRLIQPYLSFQTNNFIVKKSVLQKVNFNPEIQNYGYEDLLFAMNLNHAGIPVHHIDNPILNNDVESNEVYLKKVEESIESLHKMLVNTKTAPKIKDIKLVRAYHYLDKRGGARIFRKLFAVRKAAIRNKLLQAECNLKYLDLYKLGLLTEKSK